MNLFRQVRIRRRNLIRALQISYAARTTGIPDAFPDFMCIGAPRAATTWLHKKLQSEPQVFLPKAKELHFFDEPPPPEHGGRDGLRMHRSFYFDMGNPAHLRWYSLQFRNSNGRKKGEITPSYAALSDDRVRLISTLMPGLKVIYLIRNPIDRAWSALRQTVFYQKGADHAALRDRAWLLRTVLSPALLQGGNYRHAIETWGRMLPERDILYVFYDDIVESPKRVLADIYSFLCLEQFVDRHPSGTETPVNAGLALEMPREVRSVLAEHYEDQILFLESKFARDLRSWRPA